MALAARARWQRLRGNSYFIQNTPVIYFTIATGKRSPFPAFEAIQLHVVVGFVRRHFTVERYQNFIKTFEPNNGKLCIFGTWSGPLALHFGLKLDVQRNFVYFCGEKPSLVCFVFLPVTFFYIQLKRAFEKTNERNILCFSFLFQYMSRQGC